LLPFPRDPPSAAVTTNVALLILSGADSATLKSTLNGALNGTPLNGTVSGTG
jgi:hypothetical protein